MSFASFISNKNPAKSPIIGTFLAKFSVKSYCKSAILRFGHVYDIIVMLSVWTYFGMYEIRRPMIAILWYKLDIEGSVFNFTWGSGGPLFRKSCYKTGLGIKRGKPSSYQGGGVVTTPAADFSLSPPNQKQILKPFRWSIELSIRHPSRSFWWKENGVPAYPGLW